jgi:hypothetical protein
MKFGYLFYKTQTLIITKSDKKKKKKIKEITIIIKPLNLTNDFFHY